MPNNYSVFVVNNMSMDGYTIIFRFTNTVKSKVETNSNVRIYNISTNRSFFRGVSEERHNVVATISVICDRFSPFPGPGGHFGAPWRPFGILQVVQHCRREHVTLVPVGWYYHQNKNKEQRSSNDLGLGTITNHMRLILRPL